MTNLELKIRWFKNNKNSFFYKLFVFLIPAVSPTLSLEIQTHKLAKIFEKSLKKIYKVEFKKKRRYKGLFDRKGNIRPIVVDEITETE